MSVIYGMTEVLGKCELECSGLFWPYFIFAGLVVKFIRKCVDSALHGQKYELKPRYQVKARENTKLCNVHKNSVQNGIIFGRLALTPVGGSAII